MGREGVAFTFVTPEEGNELTRIEMRIDRLLKRDETPGFAPASREMVRSAEASAEPAPSRHGAEPDGSQAPEVKKPTPLYGRGGRPIRRIRRAL